MRAFLTAIIITGSLLFSCLILSAQEVGKVLLKGIGGKEKWESANYILFTVRGNDTNLIQNSRKFLIKPTSGQARFEGQSNDGDNIVTLFNFKTGKLSKLFV